MDNEQLKLMAQFGAVLANYAREVNGRKPNIEEDYRPMNDNRAPRGDE